MYSLAIVGHNSQDYFPEATSDRGIAIGNVAAFIEQLHHVNLIIVNKSKIRPKYPFVPPVSVGEYPEENKE